jgi:Zn-dependent protease with chaperone function
MTMAMDFFESQERAKRNTGVLVALFFVGVVATVVSVHLLLSFTLGRGNPEDPRMLLLAGGSVGAIVLIGTLVKQVQMSHGGRAVAEALGGRMVDPGSRDPSERKILNIVEEMAIASGMPVPPVYVMDDDAINAFAAGNSPKDAVIGVTAGCIRELDRAELQGVVAHEFSHIFHQDMRLNMRLVAWLGGIFAISMVGRLILRSMRGVRSSRGKNNGAAAAAMLGVGLFLIGIVGYFFGRIIQSAVSRQREYLADASAVQYTRNPEGIAGALERIGRSAAGSRVAAPAAAEFSHFFFADGVAALFSTHPPLEERIRRIRGLQLPAGAGVGPAVAEVPALGTTVASGVAGFTGHAPAAVPGSRDSTVDSGRVRSARAEIGSLDAARIDVARSLVGSIDPRMLAAAHEPFDARAAVVRLLLSADLGERMRQLAIVRANDRGLAEAAAELAGCVVPPADRLPILELCAPSIAMLAPAQYAAFRVSLAQLMAADGELDRVEWMVRVVLRQAVEGRGAAPVPNGPRPTIDDAALVASVLAWSGASDAGAAGRAWVDARAADPRLPVGPVPVARCTLDALDASVRALSQASPGFKRRVVDACVAAVTADRRTTVEEAELLRAICASIGVPMPPIEAVVSA